jgi:hypothetical protein
MIRASGEPSEKTVCLRVLQSRHVTQEETVLAKDFSSKALAFPADFAAVGCGAFSSKVEEAPGAGGARRAAGDADPYVVFSSKVNDDGAAPCSAAADPAAASPPALFPFKEIFWCSSDIAGSGACAGCAGAAGVT